MQAIGIGRRVPLPKHWPRHVRSAIVHAVSMAHVAVTAVQARAEHHFDERIRLRAANERLLRRNELLVEELRIKDARMEGAPEGHKRERVLDLQIERHVWR